MSDFPSTDPLIDDIGALIDEALDDPSRAAGVKAQLRSRLARRASDGRARAAVDAAEADAEDLWDNVPV